MFVCTIPRSAVYHTCCYWGLAQPRYGPRAMFLVTPSAVPFVTARAGSRTAPKGPSPHPEPRSSHNNFKHLATPTGYYSFTWPSLHRAEQLQRRSYLTGFSEDDPVTVYETVKMRPDLALQNLTFPITAVVQQVVNTFEQASRS